MNRHKKIQYAIDDDLAIKLGRDDNSREIQAGPIIVDLVTDLHAPRYPGDQARTSAYIEVASGEIDEVRDYEDDILQSTRRYLGRPVHWLEGDWSPNWARGTLTRFLQISPPARKGKRGQALGLRRVRSRT